VRVAETDRGGEAGNAKLAQVHPIRPTQRKWKCAYQTRRLLLLGLVLLAVFPSLTALIRREDQSWVSTLDTWAEV
jgi:hypothetical protein